MQVNSSWNGNVIEEMWYQQSIESLFDDPNVPNGNPIWPNPYQSGNCGDGAGTVSPLGITLYEYADYQGASLNLTSTDDDLCDNPLDPSQPPVNPCFSAPSWNDVASSIEVAPDYKAWLYLHSESQEQELGEYNIFRDCGAEIPDFSAPEWNFPNGVSLNDNVSRVVIAKCEPGGSAQRSPHVSATANDPCTPDPPPSTTDSATFLTDITLPDGAIVSPGQALVKIWRVQNSGTSTWDGYKLKYIDREQMGGEAEQTIPTTAPGATVDLTVNLTAPAEQGAHSGTWQIVTPDGTWVAGGQVWVKINAQPQSGNITLSADPPSPASAGQVQIRARVDNFPNLRAMRVLVDGSQICELGTPEIANCAWDTTGYAAGQHAIVVEVDDWSGPSWDNPQRKSLVYSF